MRLYSATDGPFNKIDIEGITTLIKVLVPEQWDRFVLWLLGSGPLAGVEPIPACMGIVAELYEWRIAGREIEGRYWVDAGNCLGRVALGERPDSLSLDKLPMRRRMVGRSVAMAGASLAGVYAVPLNPARTDRIPLLSSMVHSVIFSCEAYGWHRRLGGFKHRRDVHSRAALEECRIELEEFGGATTR